MKWEVTDEQSFIEFKQFAGREYALAFPNSPALDSFLDDRPPHTFENGDLREFAIIVRGKTGEIVAGCRITIIYHPEFGEFETDTESCVIVPEPSLVQYFIDESGLENPIIAEYGRLAAASSLPLGRKLMALRQVYQGMLTYGQSVGIDIGIGMGRDHVQKLLRKMKVDIHFAPELHYDRNDIDKMRNLLSRHEFAFPELNDELDEPLTSEKLASMSLEEMQALVAHLPDGQFAYWGLARVNDQKHYD